MRVRSIGGSAVCAGALALAAQGLWPAPAPVSAQGPLLRCDAPFPDRRSRGGGVAPRLLAR